jgi:heat shock transcription factor
LDYAAALSNYQTQGGQIPLTQQQRNDVLSQIVNNASVQHTDNALTNPNPPEMNKLLSDLAQYQATQQQLVMLQKLSDEQNSKIQNIHERILPLSPTGQIAGMNDQTSYFDTNGLGEPGHYDLNIDNFVQDDDFFTNNTGADNSLQSNTNGNHGGLPDFNFDTSTTFDGSGGDAFNFAGADGGDVGVDMGHLNVGGGVDEGLDESRIQSLESSNTTSPAATVEEVEDETRRRSPKRRKK